MSDQTDGLKNDFVKYKTSNNLENTKIRISREKKMARSGLLAIAVIAVVMAVSFPEGMWTVLICVCLCLVSIEPAIN